MLLNASWLDMTDSARGGMASSKSDSDTVGEPWKCRSISIVLNSDQGDGLTGSVLFVTSRANFKRVKSYQQKLLNRRLTLSVPRWPIDTFAHRLSMSIFFCSHLAILFLPAGPRGV